ncbi:hypothetical protein GCM10011506_42160 [Marivirga lumbricoides]|uniref:Secretion system C-terminal sorting domain-containing protein n=1 Tax=Marivirga lumbricoides TaxID=1046115 RepID=A0ABQ1N334_9BACT|nr:hypothetical protein GCM10011506_42160 [Marivirga lumbricoides]
MKRTTYNTLGIIVSLLFSTQLNATKYILMSSNPNDISMPVPDDNNALFSSVVPSLDSAQKYIRAYYYTGNQVDGEITDKIVIYIKGGLYKDNNILWYATSSDTTKPLKILAYNDEKVIFDGSNLNDANKGVFLRLGKRYKRTNLWIEGLTIQNYLNGISLGVSDYDTTTCTRNNSLQNSHNTLISNIFINIGNKFSSNTGYSFSAVGISNSEWNTIESNIFYKIENSSGPKLLHALYLSNNASNNTIKDNYIGLCSGDPIRLRNSSNYNKVLGNYIEQSGNSGFVTDWHCTEGAEGCKCSGQLKDEGSSIGTELYNNVFTFPYPSFTWDGTKYCSQDQRDIGYCARITIPYNASTASGSGNFVISEHPQCEVVGAATSGDINNDGIDELFAAYNYDNFTKLVRSEPNKGNYLSKVIYKSKYWHIDALEMNDFNGDGTPELITAFNALTDNTNRTEIKRGDGVTSATNYGNLWSSTWWKTRALTSGDFNGNGSIELITALNEPDNSGTQVFKGNGINSLNTSGSSIYSSTWWTTQALTAGNYDGDPNNRDEVFVAFNAPDNSQTQIFSGDGINSITNLGNGSFYSDDWWVTASLTSGDYNGDGSDEVFVAFNPRDNSQTQIFKGDGVSSISNHSNGSFYNNSSFSTDIMINGNFDNSSGEEITTFLSLQTETEGYMGNGTSSIDNLSLIYDSYNVECSGANSGMNSSARIESSSTITYISTTDSEIVDIYPNPIPSSGELIITTLNQNTKIQLFNSQGVLCQESLIQNGKLKLDNLRSGLYIARIITKDQEITRKLIVE